MSLFQTLRQNPPKLTVKDGAREIRIFLVSAMCDNKHTISLKKDDNGEFKLRGGGYHLSNFQFQGDKVTDCEWAADAGSWNDVWNFLNSGTSRIEKIICR